MKKLLSIILLTLPTLIWGQTTFTKPIDHYEVGYYKSEPFENPTLKSARIYKEGVLTNKKKVVKVVAKGEKVESMLVFDTEFEIFKWEDKDISKSFTEGDILIGNIKENIEGWYNQDEFGDYIYPRKYVYIIYKDNYITIFFEEKEKYSRYRLKK